MRVLRYILAVSLVLVIGCASIERKQLDILEQRTDNYENALRWGNYEIARAFIKKSAADQLPVEIESLKQIRVTSYKLLDRNVFESKEAAEQKVEIRFYNIDSLIEKTIIDNQTWILDKDLENWFLSSGLPDFQ